MRNVERLTSLKSELLNIFMDMEVNEHKQRARNAVQRSLRARRGIEFYQETKRLSEHLIEFPINDFLDENTH
ncbi:MAG: PA3496 family putative envelope integrity protein [Halomonas sp.]|uniref:PA3496 family putative envelope integrity protein n=1 Tax=Halomonas sp. TaxID=1486246 RepID=UPI003F8F76F3